MVAQVLYMNFHVLHLHQLEWGENTSKFYFFFVKLILFSIYRDSQLKWLTHMQL